MPFWRQTTLHAFKIASVQYFCSGEVRWQQPQPSGLQSTLPVLSVPDLNGDSVGDVALVASDNTQVNILLFFCLFVIFCFNEKNNKQTDAPL